MPTDQARNFKEHGNEYFRGKRYREAANFYTQGINVNPPDAGLREALLLNRAACNLELSESGFIFNCRAYLTASAENYGSVLKDTSAALTINPKASKAYFRASVALVALDRYEEALDVCDRCLAFEPNNSSVRGQREKVAKQKELWDWKEMEKAERLRKDREEKRVMNAAFQVRSFAISNRRPRS